MRASLWSPALLVAGLARTQLWAPLMPEIPMMSVNLDEEIRNGTAGNETFAQLIDHKNATMGNFSQKYWWSSQYWKGPGSPVILLTPGESAAQHYTAYLTTDSIMGLYAQEVGAAIVLIEHRYWGDSSPYEILDTKSLQYLTLENSIADLVHFAKTVDLPFDPSGASNADQAPWIMVGGSYSGALAAWTAKLSPGTFWAYHASSAPVEAIYDYWTYFLPIQKGMPQNCSHDMARIMNHVDKVIDSCEGKDNNTELIALKTMFDLQDLEHNDDFATAVTFPIGYWQNIGFSDGYGFIFQMCDTIEGVRQVDTTGSRGDVNIAVPNATIPTADGIGAEKALVNYAAWFKNEFLPDSCADAYSDRDTNYSSNSVACYDSYNVSSPIYTDLTVQNAWNRQWMWFTCNEPFFYWQTGAPKDNISIASRHITAEYYQRQCALQFPTQDGVYTFGSNDGKNTSTLNQLTDGWNLTNTTRLLWANGEFDPWRSAGVSSELRPGGPLASTSEAPVFLIPGARHCDDLGMRNGIVNEDVNKTQKAEIKQMKEWVAEWYEQPKACGGKPKASLQRSEGITVYLGCAEAEVKVNVG